MLAFERDVVGALMDPALDAGARAAVTSYVDTTLRSMPEHLRAGVAGESILLHAWVRCSERPGSVDAERLRARLERWKHSRIDVLRQYVRLLEGLVLFGTNELVPESP